MRVIQGPFWSDNLSDLRSNLRAAERNMNNANVLSQNEFLRELAYGKRFL